EAAQAQLTRHAAQQLPRGEVDGVRAGRALPARVGRNPRNLIAGIRGRVPVHRVVIEHTQDLGHLRLLDSEGCGETLSSAPALPLPHSDVSKTCAQRTPGNRPGAHARAPSLNPARCLACPHLLAYTPTDTAMWQAARQPRCA